MTAFEKLQPAWMAIFLAGFKAGRETNTDIDTAFNEWWEKANKGTEETTK